jgi:fructose-1,6-bisphosphatase/inositol monophosphatase family enzyme
MDFSRNARMIDIAAGLMILQEAGGVATGIHGKPVENYESVIGCSTEWINGQVRQMLAEQEG